MDTRTLVVGQRVVMVSGPYGCDGMVVEVTDGGVTVQTFACTTRVPTERCDLMAMAKVSTEARMNVAPGK